MFVVVLSTIAEEDLISKVQKEWETHGWKGGLRVIYTIQRVKDPLVMTRSADILENSGFTGEDLKLLRGCVCYCTIVIVPVCTEH